MQMDAVSGFVRSQLQDSRTRRSAVVTRRNDAKIVNILTLGLHGPGVSRF